MAIKNIMAENLEMELEEGINVVSIFGDDCSSSISDMFSKVLEELDDNNRDLNILILDGDKSADIIEENEIEELPAILIYVDGEVKEKIEDYIHTDELEEIMRLYI